MVVEMNMAFLCGLGWMFSSVFMLLRFCEDSVCIRTWQRMCVSVTERERDVYQGGAEQQHLSFSLKRLQLSVSRLWQTSKGPVLNSDDRCSVLVQCVAVGFLLWSKVSKKKKEAAEALASIVIRLIAFTKCEQIAVQKAVSNSLVYFISLYGHSKTQWGSRHLAYDCTNEATKQKENDAFIVS